MKRSPPGLLLAALMLASLLACTSSAGPIPDEQVSLRREDPLALTASPAPEITAKDPGENTRFQRAYFGAPPMIPHRIDGQAIRSDANDCLDCHEVSDEDTPGIPPSHHVVVRFDVLTRAKARHGMTTAFAGFAKADTVAGSRYNCLLCHAPQVGNAQPLVPNSFVSTTPKDAHKDVLQQLNSEGAY